MNGLANTCATFVKLPPSIPVYSKGVRYLVYCDGINSLVGVMDELKDGRKRRKHIIVRHCPHRSGMFQLYTYHFPKTWSAACVANRELIKIAQRRAHALEHDNSYVGIEWRIRFFKHYYRVYKGGGTPEPGMKPYSRFYQYTYVSIYRDLKAAQQAAQQPVHFQPIAEDVSFDPIANRPLRLEGVVSPLQSVVKRVASPPLLHKY